MSLSLNFKAVVWRIEEETMPNFTIVFVIFLVAVAFQPIVMSFLIISSVLCRCLQNNHLAIAIKRFLF